VGRRQIPERSIPRQARIVLVVFRVSGGFLFVGQVTDMAHRHDRDAEDEHPFGTLKMRMGATHFLMKRLPKVATEMALHVLAYNLTRVMNIIGVKPLVAAIRA
jgi:hypothetical protein